MAAIAQRNIWPTFRAAAPVVVLFVLIGLVAPAVLSDFRLNLLGKFLCYAILAIGIDLAWGYTGMLSIARYSMKLYFMRNPNRPATPPAAPAPGATPGPRSGAARRCSR